MANNKRRKRKKFITIFAIAFLVSYFGYTLYQQQNEITTLEARKKIFVEEIEKAQKELDRLNGILELGESDEYIEKVAREQLNMIGEGEIVIKDISPR